MGRTPLSSGVRFHFSYSVSLGDHISTGIIFYVDGLKNLYRRQLDLCRPLANGLSAIEVLASRFPGAGALSARVLVLPDTPEFDGLAMQAVALNLKTSRFSLAAVQEKPKTLQQQRWNLEDDSGNDTWVGAAMAEAVKEHGWQTAVMIPLSNLLVEPSAVAESLELFRRESFDVLAAEERICGAAWYIFQADLLLGLLQSHPDLMWARGGLAWAVRKPLYPFKVGAFHCPRVRPALAADLRLNSERAFHALSGSITEDFVQSGFSYENWLNHSGWESRWCDFAPLIVNVEPASLCNAACTGCVYPAMQRPKIIMTPEIFGRVRAAFVPGDDCRWVFSGCGEPVLNPFLADMAASVADFSAMLVTSLQKLPPEGFPVAVFDQIRISVDALAEDDFLKRRPGCSWKNVESFLNFARAGKVAAPDNFPEVGVSFLRQAVSENQQQAFLNYWKQVVKPVFKDHFFKWPFDSAPEAVQWYQIIGDATFAGARARTSKVDFTPVRRRPCRNAVLSLTVLSDGRISACPYDFEGRMIIGDIKQNSLKDIWSSEPARRFRQHHLKLELASETICSRCTDWYHPV